MQGKHYHIYPCKTSQLRFYSSVILNGTETADYEIEYGKSFTVVLY